MLTIELYDMKYMIHIYLTNEIENCHSIYYSYILRGLFTHAISISH